MAQLNPNPEIRNPNEARIPNADLRLLKYSESASGGNPMKTLVRISTFGFFQLLCRFMRSRNCFADIPVARLKATQKLLML